MHKCQRVLGQRYKKSINGLTNMHCTKQATHTYSHSVTYILQAQPNVKGIMPYHLCDEHALMYENERKSDDSPRC